MANKVAGACVLLFGKSPIKGQVKTRLATEISNDHAVQLYKCFVEDTVSLLRNLNICFKFYFCPSEAKYDVVEWLGEQDCYEPQAGIDLGTRISNAFCRVFEENFSKALAIGTDSPDLPKDFLKQALRALDTHDAVVGPSSDGGYYLIGFSQKAFLPEIFQNISWSSDKVFEQTVDILNKHKKNVYLLPQWHDVDTLDDLKSMFLRNKSTAFEESRTLSYLRSNKLWSESNV